MFHGEGLVGGQKGGIIFSRSSNRNGTTFDVQHYSDVYSYLCKQRPRI
jgi:hypothetical protein